MEYRNGLCWLLVFGTFLFGIQFAGSHYPNRRNITIGVYVDSVTYNTSQLERTVACTIAYVNNQRQIFPNTQLNYVMKVAPPNGFVNAGFQVCEMMKAGAVGLITMTSCPLTQYITSISRRYGLPHVAIPLPLCGLDLKSGSYSLRPNRSALLQLLADVVKHKRWNGIVMLYDNAMTSFAREFTVAMTRQSVRVLTLKVSKENITKPEARIVLEKIKNVPRSHKNILLLCNAHNAMTLYETAKVTGLQSQEYLWLQAEQAFTDQAVLKVTKPDASMVMVDDPHPVGCSGVLRNLLGLGCNFEIDHGQEALLVDAILTLSHVMNRAHSAGNFTANLTLNCDLKQRWSGISTVENTLQIINVEGLTGKIKFDKDRYRNFTSAQEVFVFDSSVTEKDLTTKFTRVGSWNSQSGIIIKDLLFPNEHRLFNNKTIKIVVNTSPPFVFNVRHFKNGTIDFDGFCKVILDELATRLNFTYSVFHVSDSKFGAEEPNGTWNGMVGAVMRGEADFGVGPLTITSSRSRVIDYTIPYIQDSVGFIMKKPEPPNKMFHLFRPFAPSVWGTLVTTLFIAGIALGCINRLTPNSGYRRQLKESTSAEVSVYENIWITFALFLQHGSPWYPMSASGRVLTISLAFFTAIMMAHYTADLVAHLAVPQEPHYIKTLDELTRQDKIRPLLLDGSNLVTLFKESKDGVYAKIWDMLQGVPAITDNDEGAKLLKDTGKWAFLNDMTVLEYVVAQNCNTFIKGEETFNRAGFGFLMQKNSRYATAINSMIRKMQESGLIQRWRRRWWSRSSTCSDDSKKPLQPMMLESTAGCFIMVAAGCVAGTFVLALELAFYHFGLCWKRRTASMNFVQQPVPMTPRGSKSDDSIFNFEGTNWSFTPNSPSEDLNSNAVSSF